MLQQYLSRLGFSGPASPDLATLAALHRLHPSAIPFENLDPLLGRAPSLELPALVGKMLAQRRGGYCFEQNTLFRAALEAIGFTVTSLAARVRWGLPADHPPTARGHMALLVQAEGHDYIADVGFGGNLLGGPLRLLPGCVQELPGSRVRLEEIAGQWNLAVHGEDGWRDVYRFTLEAQNPIDCEMGNWFAATHPRSRFSSLLMMQRLAPQCRISLLNRRMTRHWPDGRREEVILQTAEEFAAALERDFAIDPPAPAAEILARLAE